MTGLVDNEQRARVVSLDEETRM